MSTVVKDLGAVSAYAYAVEKGYTGTEAEFAELMADYAEVGQRAEDAADSALESKTAAQTAATTATNKASEATTAATTATNKAAEAQADADAAALDASQALSAASTATTKATEATTAAATATSAKTDAVAANTAAQSAKTAAQTAQTGAETAAASVEASAEQIATNAADISQLKSDLSTLTDLPLTWVEGYYLSKDGTKSVHESYKYSERYRINSPISFQIAYKMYVFSNIATYVLYDEDLNILYIESTSSSSLVWDESVITVTDPRAKYISFCTNITNGVYVKVASSISELGICNNAIDESMIGNGAVSLDKINDSIITHDAKTNFVDYSTISTGYYVNSSGKIRASSNVNATDFIPLEAGKTYYQRNVYQTYYAYYDSDKNFVVSYSTLGDIGVSFTVPEGCAYGRFTILDASYNARTAWIAESNGAPSAYKKTINTDNINVYALYDPLDVSNPCDYTGRDVSVFNKCICVGDSLTEGTFNYNVDGSTAHYINFNKYSYPKFFQKLTNVETTNKGHGGMSTVHWWNAEQNSDLSGYDLAIIQLGVNDMATGQTEWPAESKTAMTNIINKLIAENANIKIFVANILPATSYGGRSHISTGIANLVAELANPNVILLDMAQHSHVGQRTDYNCGHLSAYGYWRLAQDYVSYISYIMATDNADVFREIQFVGTNYQFHA